MTAILNAYLNFRGNAREAMEFYHAALGGKLDVMTFAEMGQEVGPGDADLVMHSYLETPSGFALMGSDVPSEMDYQVGTNNFSVSISGTHSDDAELRGYWDKLSQGATITQPLEAAPWGAAFGMFTDRFGVNWLINISAEG
ncbi:MAG: VOC family protein [Microbacteriaceae bacterium]|nr:VOC family protein [Microbacteriaceae bacterium]